MIEHKESHRVFISHGIKFCNTFSCKKYGCQVSNFEKSLDDYLSLDEYLKKKD